MMKLNGRPALMLAVCGTVACMASAARGQVVINQSGATLLETFLKAPAASNDYFDVDGDGFARVFGTNDQLAPFALPPAPGFGQNLQHWIIQYRSVGSVNGFQELVDFGTTFVTTADNVEIFSSKASKSFHNRTQFIANQLPSNAIFNSANPGGAPVRRDHTALHTTHTSPARGACTERTTAPRPARLSGDHRGNQVPRARAAFGPGPRPGPALRPRLQRALG